MIHNRHIRLQKRGRNSGGPRASQKISDELTLSAKTRRNAHSRLSSGLALMVQLDYLPRNPAVGLGPAQVPSNSGTWVWFECMGRAGQQVLRDEVGLADQISVGLLARAFLRATVAAPATARSARSRSGVIGLLSNSGLFLPKPLHRLRAGVIIMSTQLPNVWLATRGSGVAFDSIYLRTKADRLGHHLTFLEHPPTIAGGAG